MGMNICLSCTCIGPDSRVANYLKCLSILRNLQLFVFVRLYVVESHSYSTFICSCVNPCKIPLLMLCWFKLHLVVVTYMITKM